MPITVLHPPGPDLNELPSPHDAKIRRISLRSLLYDGHAVHNLEGLVLVPHLRIRVLPSGLKLRARLLPALAPLGLEPLLPEGGGVPVLRPPGLVLAPPLRVGEPLPRAAVALLPAFPLKEAVEARGLWSHLLCGSGRCLLVPRLHDCPGSWQWPGSLDLQALQRRRIERGQVVHLKHVIEDHSVGIKPRWNEGCDQGLRPVDAHSPDLVLCSCKVAGPPIRPGTAQESP
mmetsp:Transcript_126652/g.370051  ORF Transcript_126652/g.370051 Transcript_126652/m.370051 type:complete len:230 (+) Transcript_126652:919-1608(+)